MKNLKSVLLAIMSVFVAFVCLYSPVLAKENISDDSTNTPQNIMPYESDWPDYDYGGWKETIANPKSKEKLIKCMLAAGVPGAIAIVAGIATGTAITFAWLTSKLGFPEAWAVWACMTL